MARTRNTPAQSVPVFRADDVRATDGANMGDTLSFSSELMLDDVYELPRDVDPVRLSMIPTSEHIFRIAEDTEIGTPGAQLFLDAVLSFMSPDGQSQDSILLVEVDEDGVAAGIYLLPLAAMQAQTEYRLVGIDTENQLKTFAQVACVSFTRGTHIAMATGEQRKIEDLEVGDRILTRDDGVQKIRWIGQSTTRAVGEFAPILITAGTLNNENDLLVSPDHRLFIYQRSDEVGAGRSELLVKARHLVNDETVRVQEGGFVDYFQLLFDSHQIVYAEGIAAETMLIDTRTKAVLPDELVEELGDVIPGHSDLPHAGLDVSEGLLGPDAADLLRKASTR